MTAPRGENFQPKPEGQTMAEGTEVPSPAEDQAVESQAGKPLFSRIETLRARIREMIGREPDEAQQQVRELKEEETNQRGGIVDSLLKRFHLRQTQRELLFPAPDISHLFVSSEKTVTPPVPVSESAVEERVSDDLSLLAESKGAVQTQTGLDSLVDEVAKGIELQMPEEQHESEGQRPDLKEIARREGLTFVHSIRPAEESATQRGYQNADAISVLRESVDWRQKIDILLSLEPCIACSTVKPGDSSRNTYYGMGAILTGGAVEYASPKDVTSQATGFNKRQPGREKRLSDVDGEIRQAIDERPDDNYNEFGIRDPKVAGLFVCRNKKFNYAEDISLFPDEALATAAQERGLPLFVIVEGEVWHGQLDTGTKKIRPTKLANPDEVYDRPNGIVPEQKDGVLEELFENSPFNLDKIGCAEAKYVDGRFYGRQTAVELLAATAPGSVDQLTFHGVNKRVEYSLRDGQMWQRSEVARTKAWEVPVGQTSSLKFGYIDMSFGGSTMQIGERVGSAEEYLAGMGAVIEKRRASALEPETYPGQRKFDEETIATLAYHLYGFGEQAGQMGNHEIAARARALAEQIVPKEEYEDVLHRRVGEKGKFKITRKDLNLPEAAENRELKITRQDYEAVISNPNRTPADFVDLLKPDFGTELSSGVGVKEGYSLEQHTLMALGQFEKYFKDQPLPLGLSPDFFRSFLTLHDIGKPEAVRRGNKDLQHEHTGPIMDSVLGKFGFGRKERVIAQQLLKGDPIGEWVNADNDDDLDRSAQMISRRAQEAGVPVGEFFNLLEVYYKVDAGSYTEDAGGKPALDRLFVFDPANHRLDFSPATERRVARLRQALPAEPTA